MPMPLTGAHDAAWYSHAVPVSADDRSGSRSGVAAAVTDRMPSFEAGELFAESDGEKTVVTAIPFELRPRFTGRRAALEALTDALDQVVESRQLRFALVVGEPGMGKSRLVAEAGKAALARRPDARLLVGAPDEGGAAFDAVARLLSQRFGLVAGEPAATSRQRIAATVAELLPAGRAMEVSHLLAHLVRVPFEDSPVVGPLVESPQQLETRTFLAVRRFLTADAEQRPLVLVIENLEQCGAETVNLLHYLAAGLASTPVLLIGTGTEALTERHPSVGDGDHPPTRIDLGPLSAIEAEELLRELLRPLDPVPDRLVAHARTIGGSPRALHELVRLLLEADCIVRGEGLTWRLDPVRLAGLALPGTYDELVAARLAVMDPAERRVLEMVAAMGETSWHDAVVGLDRAEAVTTADPDGPTLAQIASSGDHGRLAITGAIGHLVERGWLIEVAESSIPGEREVRFADHTLWTLVYRGTAEARRRVYHGAAARWLELGSEGRAADVQEDVARHLELAGERREAALRYRRAAEAARAAYFNERAIRLYDRALACVSDSDAAARIHLWHDLGTIYELIGDFEAALGAFERMLRLSWVAASKTKAAVAFNKIGRVWRRKGDLKLALDYLERGAELFRATGDSRGIPASLDDIGKTLAMLGRTDEAFHHITQALAMRGKGGDKRSIAASLSNLGNVQQARGQFAAAYNCHKEALTLRQEAGDRWGVVGSQNNLAVLAFERGEAAEARALWLAALAEAEAIGALPMSALVLCNLGELAVHEGKLEEAQRRLDDALELAEDIEDRELEAECCRHLARVESQSGHTQAARELAERALAVASKAGLREREAQALVTLGQVLSTSLYDADKTEIMDVAAVSPAEACLKKAVALLRELGNQAELAKALDAYGRHKIESGAMAEGREMLREALVAFKLLGMKRAAEVERLLSGV